MKRPSRRLAVAATAVMSAASEGNLCKANSGTDFAQNTLAQAQALETREAGTANVQERDSAMQSLRKETGDRLSKLTEEDRIYYVHFMGIELAKGGIDGPEATVRSTAAFVFISAGTSPEDRIGGASRMLSSDAPNIRQSGLNIALLPDTYSRCPGNHDHESTNLSALCQVDLPGNIYYEATRCLRLFPQKD